MLQVVGQVAARQLDRAAIGTGYHIEGAGGEVALREKQRQTGNVSSDSHTHTHPHVGPSARPLPENNKGGGEAGGQQVSGRDRKGSRDEKIKNDGGEKYEGNTREDIKASHLQLLHLAGPAAALLTVDAADGQRQDLLLQLWVWVDLKKISKVSVAVAAMHNLNV